MSMSHEKRYQQILRHEGLFGNSKGILQNFATQKSAPPGLKLKKEFWQYHRSIKNPREKKSKIITADSESELKVLMVLESVASDQHVQLYNQLIENWMHLRWSRLEGKIEGKIESKFQYEQTNYFSRLP